MYHYTSFLDVVATGCSMFVLFFVVEMRETFKRLNITDDDMILLMNGNTHRNTTENKYT